jgi:AbrB family looped-hinge helix DNA binding protein
MLTTEAKLSSKHQIVVPRAAREALDLRAGDTLLVVVRGDAVILLRKPPKHSRAVLGTGRGLYPRGYLKHERESWR